MHACTLYHEQGIMCKTLCVQYHGHIYAYMARKISVYAWTWLNMYVANGNNNNYE